MYETVSGAGIAGVEDGRAGAGAAERRAPAGGDCGGRWAAGGRFVDGTKEG